MGTVQIDGSTPKLTIGNATAEDALIVFDGNAQDFYIGLDDSADDLVIGLGSAAGTTPAISINEDRDVTISDGAIDFDIASHDTSNGLKLGGTLVTATASEINLIDGSSKSTSSITVADADAFIVIDGTTTKQIPASDIKTYAGGAVSAINNATANELVTIGSTTTELDAESGLTYTDGALVIGGTTPSLTIGDAGAEDTKIVFDGNAQDYYIGLDDSSDDLVIGLGSTVGTTAHIICDEAGHVTMPLQSAFCAHVAGSDVNVDASSTTVVYGTERFDLNADYGSNTFTAPVTGKYFISASIVHQDIADQYIEFKLKSSNRDWTTHHEVGTSTPFNTVAQNCIIDMDASDTVYVTVDAESDSDWNIRAGQGHFAGYLVA